MQYVKPRAAHLTKPVAAIQTVAATMFFTVLLAGFISERTSHAKVAALSGKEIRTSGMSVQQPDKEQTGGQTQQGKAQGQPENQTSQQASGSGHSTPLLTPSSQSQQTTGDPHTGHQTPPGRSQQPVPTGPVMTLADLERMALQNNPTLAQAEAAIRAAQGRRRQAGLWPNPVVGYMGEEISFRAPRKTSEHMFFVEQTIILGGKLRKSKRVFELEAAEAESEAVAQKARVLNTVRMLYYEVLGAQQLVDLRAELARIARDAVKITAELLNVGQADRPDYLEAEVEAQQVELEFESAQNDLEQDWLLLGAMVGNPRLERAHLVGSLEEGLPVLDRELLMTTILRDSPEIKRARTEVERAQAVLSRARAERIPNMFVRGGVGYNNELLDVDNRPVGKEAFVEVGITLPIFNRNQGGIAAAEAELALVERETQRLELVLRTRLAQAFMNYKNAFRTVQRYQQIVLPRAREAYNRYLVSFREMGASYPQVLISQRTLFQVREDYVKALIDVRQNAIQIEGFLLTGGLNAPRLQPFEGGEGEDATPGVLHGRQGGGVRQEKER